MENYKLLNVRKGYNEFENCKTIERTYLINKEKYNGFILETIGFTSENMNKKDENIYYIETKIKYNNKILDKIPGSQGIKMSINKTKKWLDKNGTNLISGAKKYRIKST
jgi:hypothetical protein